MDEGETSTPFPARSTLLVAIFDLLSFRYFKPIRKQHTKNIEIQASSSRSSLQLLLHVCGLAIATHMVHRTSSTHFSFRRPAPGRVEAAKSFVEDSTNRLLYMGIHASYAGILSTIETVRHVLTAQTAEHPAHEHSRIWLSARIQWLQ